MCHMSYSEYCTYIGQSLQLWVALLVSMWPLSLIKDTFEGMPKTDFPSLSSKTKITIVFSVVSGSFLSREILHDLQILQTKKAATSEKIWRNLKLDLAHILQISGHSKSEGYGLDPPSDFFRFFLTWQLFWSEESEDHEEFLTIRTSLSVVSNPLAHMGFL